MKFNRYTKIFNKQKNKLKQVVIIIGKKSLKKMQKGVDNMEGMEYKTRYRPRGWTRPEGFVRSKELRESYKTS